MTEEEAKNKWCPQYRYSVSSDGIVCDNRDGDFNDRCIASDCMWWIEDDPMSEYDENTHKFTGNLINRGHCGAINK